MAVIGSTVWFGDITFTGPFVFEDEEKNVIVAGTIQSEFDITFKVNNFVFLTGLISSNNFTAHSKEEFVFFSGLINTKNDCNLCSKKRMFVCGEKKDEGAVQIIRELGVQLQKALESEDWHFRIPGNVVWFEK
jgi:hypothetical protein